MVNPVYLRLPENLFDALAQMESRVQIRTEGFLNNNPAPVIGAGYLLLQPLLPKTFNDGLVAGRRQRQIKYIIASGIDLRI